MPQWTVRLPDDLAKQITELAKSRGFSSPRAFIREALRKEVLRVGSSDDLEARLAASLDRFARELRRLQTAQQAQFALTDSLARVIFTCVPEPPGDAIEPARSRAKLRYDRFIKSVALSMAGTSRTAFSELVGRDE
jgi:Arc/MetJ-type ribon-helix-helix transcriptional regulator